jgi:hypothetical protein
MKKDKHLQDVEPDTLRPEYDLSRLVPVGERGKYHKALRRDIRARCSIRMAHRRSHTSSSARDNTSRP